MNSEERPRKLQRQFSIRGLEIKRFSQRLKLKTDEGSKVGRSTGDQQHLKDTFISFPLEQNLPRGLMLRLLRFNGLLIVQKPRGRTNDARIESRRNQKNGWERGRIARDLANISFTRKESKLRPPLEIFPGLCVWSNGLQNSRVTTSISIREAKLFGKRLRETLVHAKEKGLRSGPWSGLTRDDNLTVHGFPLYSWYGLRHFGSLVPSTTTLSRTGITLMVHACSLSNCRDLLA